MLLTIAIASGCASTSRVARAPTVTPEAAERAAKYAVSVVGVPYRYGGSTPTQGFDCGGLVQWSYARAGLQLPRTTDALLGATWSIPIDKIRRGDLLFFTQLDKKSSHIGIYVGNSNFVHAPRTGKNVEIVTLSDYWKKHLDDIRRPGSY